MVDNEWSMREYGSQAVVWRTALNPVVALELLAEGAWSRVGVLGPEAFPAQPFLDKLAVFGSPHVRPPGIDGFEVLRRLLDAPDLARPGLSM